MLLSSGSRRLAVTDGAGEAVGKTPLIRLRGLDRELPAVEVLAKAEYLNPSGSVKDRLALHILRGLEQQGKLTESTTLVLPTTGNLGVSVALLAQKFGCTLVALVPERTSQDRIRLLRSLGAEILRTPNDAHPHAAESYTGLARKIVNRVQNGVLIDEFHDPTTPDAYRAMADEIYEQCQGRLDAVFVGVESGSAAAGLNKYLKSRIANVKIIAVESSNSSLSGKTPSKTKITKTWRVEDLGNTFASDVLKGTTFDGWVKVDDRDAYSYARRLCRENGLLCGPSSGATLCAAVRYAAQEGLPDGARIVVVLNDSARNYQSTLLSDEWLVENDLADESTTQQLLYRAIDKYRGASIEDLQLPAAVCVTRQTSISSSLDIMETNGFSQVPVVNDARGFVGFLSLENVQLRLESGQASFEDPVEKWMYTFSRSGSGNGHKNYKVITPDTSLAELDEFFELFPAAFVTDEQRKFCLGVVTKYDLVSFLSRRPSSAFQEPLQFQQTAPQESEKLPVAGSIQAEAPPPSFSLEEIIRPNIRSLHPYRCARDDFSTGILLDANENAYGPCLPRHAAGTPSSDAAAVAAVRSSLNRYPDPRQVAVKRRFAEFRGLPSEDYLFVGVGSDEVIDLLIRICCVPGRDKIMVTPPTYGMYQVCAQTNDVGVRKVPLNVKDGRFQLRVDEVKRALSADPDVKILFLCSPGNPTGSLLDPQDVKALLEYRSYRGLIVVDEAYIDFAETVDGQNPSAATWVMDYPNLLVSQTLSKSFGLAAIRFGVGIAQPALIQYLSKAKAPYNLSTPTLSIAEEALSAEGVEAMRRNVAVLVSDRRRLIEALRAMPRIGKILGLCDANFVLAEVLDRDGNPSNAAAQAVYEALAKDRGVVVRFRGNEPGCFACLRITVGTAEEIGVLLRELTKIFERAEV